MPLAAQTSMAGTKPTLHIVQFLTSTTAGRYFNSEVRVPNAIPSKPFHYPKQSIKGKESKGICGLNGNRSPRQFDSFPSFICDFFLPPTQLRNRQMNKK
ncbi:hypothetical protein JTE90_005715 [Oedothorax gibbosus]|uniref:Uncharacterized protein n=1 Tax=Oedothorax gibbosus TaxID=931172 RepID=A0AAV6UMT9_9ARAC|nr:hypothetical protein JTE90_005715 [Oedothorax gibbosus]